MGAFQRQVLIVQVIKKKKKVSQIDYQQTIKKLFTYKFMTLNIDLKGLVFHFTFKNDKRFT